MVKLSIIIPCFNATKYIQKFVENISGLWNHKDVEFIFINDGSTDDTLIILEKYAKNIANIFLYHKKHIGPSKARNLGVDHSKGEWLWFCDIDDVILNIFYIKNLISKYKAISEDIITFRHNIVNINKKHQKKSTTYYGCIRYHHRKQFYEKLQFKYYYMDLVIWNKMFRKSFLNKIKFINSLSEDIYYINEVLSQYPSTFVYNKTLYQHNNNIPLSLANVFNNNDKIKNAFYILQKFNKDYYDISALIIISNKIHLLSKDQYILFKNHFNIYKNHWLYRRFYFSSFKKMIFYSLLKMRMFKINIIIMRFFSRQNID